MYSKNSIYPPVSLIKKNIFKYTPLPFFFRTLSLTRFFDRYGTLVTNAEHESDTQIYLQLQLGSCI